MKRLIFLILLMLPMLFLTAWSSSYEEITDVKNFSQNVNSYIGKDLTHRRLIPITDQSHLNMEYDSHYFAPWDRREPGHPKKDAEWSFQEFRNQTGYDETKKEWKSEWVDKIEANANLDAFPNKRLRVITIHNTSLRMLPTHKPFFYNFDLEGEGYPFDNFQHSALPAGTPIFVSHISKDGAWSLAETHYGLGWTPSEDLAYVTRDFIKLWKNGRYATSI